MAKTKKNLKRLKENNYFYPKNTDYKIYHNKHFNFNNLITKSLMSFSSQVTVYKNNKLVFNLQNKKDSKIIETLSVTKSFCSFAIMFLIQDRKIDDITDPVSKYIKSWGYGKKKDITIKHILTHTSGLDNYWNFDEFMWPNGNYDDYLKKQNPTPNANRIAIVVDKVHKPDSKYRYNDIATQIIPIIVKKITHLDISKYLEIKLFKPLHIKYYWNKDDYGNGYGMNGLFINSNDLCKVGLLILNNGKYNKKQILQASLVDKMIHPYIDKKKIISDEMWKNTDMTNYGLMWWRHKHLIIAHGYLGQMLIIDKKNNMVASRLLESKWDNKDFVKETEQDKIYFNEFKDLIMQLSSNKTKKKSKSRAKGHSLNIVKQSRFYKYRNTS